MIDVLQGFPKKVIAVACSGRVTKRDYETVLIPAVKETLKQPGKVRLYYRVGPEFEHIEPGAVWDDFKVGMEHISRWERIAVVTDVEWIQHAVHAFSFMLPGALKTFRTAEDAEARKWIVAGMTAAA